MKDLWRITAPASVVLTLATWLVFKYASATSPDPLGVAETTVVFAFWFAVTAGVRWLWRRFRKDPSGGSSHEVPNA